MKYLVLAMLLSFVQTVSPAQGNAPDTDTGSNHSVQGDPAAKQKPPDSSLPIKNANGPQTNKQPCDTPSNPADHITVIVQPPTSGWEKAYVIFTGLLVAVGAGGIGYAIKTLRAVERQAKATEDQLIETQNSAVFARKSVMASERADILLDAAGIVPSANGAIDGDARLKLHYKNFGRTRAKDVRFKVEMEIPGVTLTGAVEELPPMVMGSGQDQTVSFQTFRECLMEKTFKEIVQGKIKLQFIALVIRARTLLKFGQSSPTLNSSSFARPMRPGRAHRATKARGRSPRAGSPATLPAARLRATLPARWTGTRSLAASAGAVSPSCPASSSGKAPLPDSEGGNRLAG
jgi:hypothetical protein